MSTEKTKTWDDVEILIVGAGTMGASLTQAYAQSGFTVGVVDVGEEILDRARATIRKELESAKKAGIFTAAQTQTIDSRILMTTNYEKACGGKNLRLVIESATERLEIKKQIFKKLDELCGPQVVLATNSSSLDTNILARETQRPDKIVWMHYFYLPHKNRAGEYAGTATASPESIATAAYFMKLAGKMATPVLSSRKGGAADVIFVALLLEAARMLEEGFDIPSIEEAGKRAFQMPLGFFALMDATGLPVGYYSMRSFAEATSPNDPLYQVYRNFFTPPQNYTKLMQEYDAASDKSKIKWLTPEALKNPIKSEELVEKLKERFWAIAFMTAIEIVDAKVIAIQEVEKLCQNAFLWKETPFSLMNKIGIAQTKHLVEERAQLAQKQGIHFPVPALLNSQAQAQALWPFQLSPIIYTQEQHGLVARIMLSAPQNANSLDSDVFAQLKEAFQKANSDSQVKVIIFDTAPIKTFIAGANVRQFVKNIQDKNYAKIWEETTEWQNVLFHYMTGGGKPKIAIVDGTSYGGGVETAMAFAHDPQTTVLLTDRTTFTLPETRLGIYPGLRGTLLLPRLIYRATQDAGLALALARYYILAGGTTISSPRVLKFLGMCDLLVPAHKRDDVAGVIAQSLIASGSSKLTPAELARLDVSRLPETLEPGEKEELGWMKDLFSKPDLLPTLLAIGRGWLDPFLSGRHKDQVVRAARRVGGNSLNAVHLSNYLITKGFQDFLQGKNLEESARWELDRHLVAVFEHPDALEGLSALLDKRPAQFSPRDQL